MENVHINFVNNDHGALLGGDITIVGQLQSDPPIVFIGNKYDMIHSKRNSHPMPHPLQGEIVNGCMIVLRMDAGVAYDLNMDEYKTITCFVQP